MLILFSELDGTSLPALFCHLRRRIAFRARRTTAHFPAPAGDTNLRNRTVTLFNRTQRSVALNPVPQCAAWRSAAHTGPHGASGDDGETGRRGESATSPSGSDYNVLPVSLREFRRAFPLVNLTLHVSTMDAQIRDLLAGRIDVGFGLPPINEPSRAWRRHDNLPALRVFADVASRTANMPRIARSPA